MVARHFKNPLHNSDSKYFHILKTRKAPFVLILYERSFLVCHHKNRGLSFSLFNLFLDLASRFGVQK